MKYDKLVRDRIPEIIRSKGEVPVMHIAPDEEYRARLAEKLREEVAELLDPDANLCDELADVLEVLEALRVLHGLSEEEVQARKTQKRNDRG
jgi:predicted house-cleaning noncanonical NTP pyrophosphatase (MazG superfamily)